MESLSLCPIAVQHVFEEREQKWSDQNVKPSVNWQKKKSATIDVNSDIQET